MSKSWRFVEIARRAIEASQHCDTEVLDLSRLLAEYGRHIHPCKACYSTAAALCHWPCSCYPNYSLGQTHDWMNEIYPMWVAAHGVMIITPVHWYQASSPLKLLINRMVGADGGNPDPTTTQGKDAKLAKQIEMRGWDYPRHLAGRPFSVVVHGDTEGVVSAGAKAELDRDEAVQQEVANAVRTPHCGGHRRAVRPLGAGRRGFARSAAEIADPRRIPGSAFAMRRGNFSLLPVLTPR